MRATSLSARKSDRTKEGQKRADEKTSALCFKVLNDLKDFKDFKVIREPPVSAATTPFLYPLRKLSAAQPSR